MKTFAILFILVALNFSSFGQTKSIELKEIKSFAKSDLYKSLFDRFIANDTTLSVDDYVLIYYGQAYRPDYNPSARHDSVRALNKLLNNKIEAIDFQKVVFYSTMIVSEFPFSIDQIYITGIAFEKLGYKDSSDLWFYKYDKLIRAIFTSGNGKSDKTAFVVVKIPDEYSVLNALDLQFTKQSLVNKKKKYYDLMEVEENEYGIKELYFDINLFFK